MSTSKPLAVVIPREYHAPVVATTKVNPKIFIVRLRPAAPLAFRAGQYASWLIGDKRRPLSFATPDTFPDVDFVVDVSPGGVASTYIEQLRVGDEVRFLSPYGRFVVDTDSPRPRLFIATGSGIGPIRAQILQVLLTQRREPLTLIFGNRDEEYMFLDEEFARLAQQYPHFMFIPVCSSPSPAWGGERGLVYEVMARRVPRIVDHDVYVCGGPVMVSATTAALQREGIPPGQVHTERFIPI